jgi:signal transduction histidine kinase
MISVPILYCFTLLIPLSFGISILRYHLWDIDVIINRTLVYSGLSFSIIGIYVLVVGVFQTLLQLHSNLVISLIATSLIAVFFQPLRNHLQRGVNRMMYGERDDPYAVLSQLGQRLEATLVPETVLSVIVETVTQALKLPYAAIALKQDDIFKITASCGSPRDDLLRLPLTYQSEIIGELILVSRVPGEALTLADHRLLSDIAHQAGVAAHAVRLTTDLQRSREHLVTAREEERRRLRRDLHDGLGPTLSALTLKVGSARFLLTSNPAAADILLSELEGNIKSAVADIRRLVYDLRPPALDELGLIGAIREYAVECSELRRSGSDGNRTLDITVDVPEFLPPLSAAVEVAVYRITQEALTNVIRHAYAQTCLIGLSLKDTLRLEITDDGVGLSTKRRPGVGLTSMRERAMELGGTFLVETTSTGGTRIFVCLPLQKVTQEDEMPEKLS